MNFKNLNVEGLKKLLDDYIYGFTTMDETIRPLKTIFAPSVIDELVIIGLMTLVDAEQKSNEILA